ncbi:MAG: YqhA family protein [Cyclobacteriaceae bacterium]|nr:YqhA family protein [Cyclobacteriaceae bacterium]
MIERIFKIRYLAILINIFVGINTLALIFIGIMRTFYAIKHIADVNKLSDHNYRPGIEIAEAIDVFLIALVFLVFLIGINTLFIKYNDEEYLKSIPKWMRVKDFSQLKLILMEAIIATAFIMFISAFISQLEEFNWEFLVVPISILLLAISFKVLKWKEDH